MLIIAHRGASADRPEHTLDAYALAVEQGADVIEPDLVITRDGHLVARHENEISGTTDVASRPAFSDRRTTKCVDGRDVTGWFAEDFTLDEIKALRAVERLPDLRPHNTAYNGQFEVPTFDEILALADALGHARGRPVGVYPETKHPSYARRIGLPLEEPLVAALHARGLDGHDDPVWIQSFEVGNLRRLRSMTGLRLVQLAEPGNAPADVPGCPYESMLTPSGLAEIATYADAIGVAIPLVLDPATLAPTQLVADAHAVGLAVHVWTVRPENAFLPPQLRSLGPPSAHGDLASLARALATTGADGVFTDAPSSTLRVLDAD